MSAIEMTVRADILELRAALQDVGALPPYVLRVPIELVDVARAALGTDIVDIEVEALDPDAPPDTLLIEGRDGETARPNRTAPNERRSHMAGVVRAKFRLNSYTTEMHRQPGRKADGSQDWQNTTPVEKRTLNFTPVYEESGENRSFWDATPSGSLQLGVVNPEAWEHFELEKEYYLDFTPAD